MRIADWNVELCTNRY